MRGIVTALSTKWGDKSVEAKNRKRVMMLFGEFVIFVTMQTARGASLGSWWLGLAVWFL